jgi:23S rRNA pseudouridine955/2504/2580 synthase
MSGVIHVFVDVEDADIRVDRWFRRHYPDLGHGRLEKLLRTGQVRVNGKKVKSGERLNVGAELRIPPLETTQKHMPAKSVLQPVDPEVVADVKRRILYQDDDVIIINKASGLPVQGGRGIAVHVDGLLDELRFGLDDRPKLVHRLDKDTSGVLVLARRTSVAATLSRAFQEKSVRKIYWAIVVGVPRPGEGRIDARLAKQGHPGGERVVITRDGKHASSLFCTVELAGRRVAWLALQPETGRTHQLRVHCADGLGCPILGDGKYGGERAHPPIEGISPQLHLHARSISMPHPSDPSGRKRLDVTAPLPPHMEAAWRVFGFSETPAYDPFAEVRD